MTTQFKEQGAAAAEWEIAASDYWGPADGSPGVEVGVYEEPEPARSVACEGNTVIQPGDDEFGKY